MNDIIARLATALKTAREHLDTCLEQQLNGNIAVIDQVLADATQLHGVRPFLDCSSAHLPRYICDRLNDDSIEGVIVRKHEHGWWVHVPLSDDPADKDVAQIYAAIPNELQQLLDRARSLGCWWINFDQDAEPVPQFPLFADDEEARSASTPAEIFAAPSNPIPAQATNANGSLSPTQGSRQAALTATGEAGRSQ